jgi:hypothetical protein
MKKLLVLFLISSLLCPRALAESVALDKDQKAPFAGVLMDPETANKTKIGLLERDLYKELSDSQGKSISILKENIGLHESSKEKLLEQLDRSSEALKSAQSFNSLERIGLILLGAALVVAGGYIVKGINQ